MVAATATTVSSASSTANADQIAVIAAAAKKFMEQPPADATSETLHAKSAVVTPPEDVDAIMNDDAMRDQLRQFYALSADETPAASKVKSIMSNMVTLFICSLVILTVVAAVAPVH